MNEHPTSEQTIAGWMVGAQAGWTAAWGTEPATAAGDPCRPGVVLPDVDALTGPTPLSAAPARRCSALDPARPGGAHSLAADADRAGPAPTTTTNTGRLSRNLQAPDQRS